MQYIWKLFKWENGTERTDFTPYLSVPIFLELRCNEQLPTGQVTLENMPTNIYAESFPPKTKFTLERWINGALNKEYDYCVEHDDIEHYVGCPQICTHRIHLIDAAVFAQGMNCDNFSLTYELSDVTLNYKTVISSTDPAVPSRADDLIGWWHFRPNWEYGGTQYAPQAVGDSWYNTNLGNYTELYRNSFQYVWDGLDALNVFLKNVNALQPKDISFEIPIVKCYANKDSGVADYLFDCPMRCRVVRTTLRNGEPVSGSAYTERNILYSPNNVQNRNDRYMYNADGKAGLRTTAEGSYIYNVPYGGTESRPYDAVKIFREKEIENFPAMINTNNTSNSSREVKFPTATFSQAELESGWSYNYTVTVTIEPYQSGALVEHDEKKCTVVFEDLPWYQNIIFQLDKVHYNIITSSSSKPSTNRLSVNVSFQCRNMLVDAPVDETYPFLLKGREYNCFDLFRKAMLTCDTQIFDNTQKGLDEMYDTDYNDIGIQYPIEVHIDWISPMKHAIMHESVFENKNLWEVIVQIGYYLHAVPRLKFARNGKERFVLDFIQLGNTTIENKDSTKITVFNSLTLDNFFTQYDSYVTNLFSPQNEVEEWLVPKTSDSSYLVSNNTAELHTKYNITEIVEFEIVYDENEPVSILDYIFEKSVYETLSARTEFTPAKWMALYYSMGDSKIYGLNYVPPAKSSGDTYMALKSIISKVFNIDLSPPGKPPVEILFNNVKFRIRYKTQDSLRITQLRPDLERYMKSSEFEKYPHHEQFYNQQDKIVDSERFTANLWGKLIRVANGIYQCQEYCTFGQEKEPGDLVELNGSSYYVTECENEYYPDAIFQKVTYSKNFNQLAQIVTIPSEPRFYEVSERSMIRREVRLLEFIKLSTKKNTFAAPSRYFNPNIWHEFIRNLLFNENEITLPNFAYINFKGDVWREHANLRDNDVNILFPSSETKPVDGVIQPAPSTNHIAVIVPVLHFPLRNAIVFEWDMDDNFKAGDCVDTSVSGTGNTNDDSYYTLQPVRYCDVYGRADLFDFKLFYKTDWTQPQIQRLPYAIDSDFKPTDSQSIIFIPENLSVGLDKDNREALSFNYQLNLLHDSHDDDSEDFIIFPNLFGEKKARLKVVLLKNTVSMFNETVEISMKTVVADEALGEISYEFVDLPNAIRIDFTLSENIDISEAQSIVMYDTENVDIYAYIAKNVSKLPDNQKLQPWYIYPVYNN